MVTVGRSKESNIVINMGVIGRKHLEVFYDTDSGLFFLMDNHSVNHTYINNMNRNFFDFPISKYQLHMLNAVEFERYFDTILELKSKKTCSLPMQPSFTNRIPPTWQSVPHSSRVSFVASARKWNR